MNKRMKKEDFLNDPDVGDFLDWLADTLTALRICLDIKRSRFVPSALRVDVIGLESVLAHYTWKSHGMATGDWGETKSRLTALANALRRAIRSGNNAGAIVACEDILKWGGNRDKKRGAYPFLAKKATAGSLCKYVSDTGAAFSLNAANVNALTPPAELLNSMLTKVHALYAADGLPIYDSRVAAAIASLVEMWRVATGKSANPLPALLTFPATMTSRTVLRLFPHANHPGVMAYGAPKKTAEQWASSKVRLGWIMESILAKKPALFSGCCPAAGPADRMHAFEASLFMVGYDVTCLDCTLQGKPHPDYKKPSISRASPSRLNKEPKSIMPLSGQGNPIVYAGDIETGFEGNWGRLRLKELEPQFVESVQIEFGGRNDVPLGANRTGVVPADSFGQWLLDEGWPSRQYVSAIAAILHAEGVISSHRRKGHGILLDFSD